MRLTHRDGMTLHVHVLRGTFPVHFDWRDRKTGEPRQFTEPRRITRVVAHTEPCVWGENGVCTIPPEIEGTAVHNPKDAYRARTGFFKAWERLVRQLEESRDGVYEWYAALWRYEADQADKRRLREEEKKREAAEREREMLVVREPALLGGK